MIEKFLSMLGRQIRHTVQDVVHSEEFHELKQEINENIRDAVGSTRSRKSKKNRKYRDPAQVRPPRAYRAEEVPPSSVEAHIKPLTYTDPKFPWRKVSSMLLLVFGSIMGVIAAIGVLALGISLFVTPSLEVLAGILFGMILPFGGASAWMLGKGVQVRGRLQRVKRYLLAAGNAGFCSVEQLAASVNKTPQFVVKDLKKMIRLEMIPNGYMDDQQTCLMLGEETYSQYLAAKQSMQEREAQKHAKGAPATKSTALDKGREHLRQIELAKEFIHDEEMVRKIARIEGITAKIFDYIEKHPEKEGQVRKFNDYYLPTTLKLIHSYCHFDAQPVQGENITTAKAQIRETLDTINTAFENLLDSLFGDATLDISTDISVLEAMLAREGLTGDDFKKHDSMG